MTTVSGSRHVGALSSPTEPPPAVTHSKPDDREAPTYDAHRDGLLAAFARSSGTGDSCSADLRPTLRYEPYTAGGALFLRREEEASAVGVDDVRQGSLNDCYFMAVVAGMASSPQGRERIMHMMTPLPNGHVRVAFATGRSVDVDPRQLANGGAHFGKGGDDERSALEGPIEQWPAVLEAAYAKWTAENGFDDLPSQEADSTKRRTFEQYAQAGLIREDDPRLLERGYAAIGNCGVPERAMNDLLGNAAALPKDASEKLTTASAAEKIKRAFSAGDVIVIETGSSPGVGLRADHAYTLTSVDGERVHMRDPITGYDNIVTFGEIAGFAKRITSASVH